MSDAPSEYSFKPYEVPTRGRPPTPRLAYEDNPDGTRLVLNNSAHVLCITRADGTRVPLDRIGGATLGPGDSVSLPLSEARDVDYTDVIRTRIESMREYALANAARFDDDDEARQRFDRAPERWWWYRRETADGLIIHLHQASSNARLSVSIAGDMGFQGSWCYADHRDGWRAAMAWNGWGDPPDGWHRHLETARRRKDGTAASEYVLAYETGAAGMPR